MFHKFVSSDLPPLPDIFNSPFSSSVPPIVKAAAREVLEYVRGNRRLHDAFAPGKMLGVLVVKRGDELGYIAAFSGNIPDDIGEISYFVPPVFDLRSSSSFFPEEEQKIVKITDDIEEILHSDRYQSAQIESARISEQAAAEIEAFKHKMEADKRERDSFRSAGIDANREAQLIKESQFAKAQYKRLRKYWQEQIDNADKCICGLNHEVEELQKKRAADSAELQTRLFRQFVFRNARGESQSLLDIFAHSNLPNKLPPAGAGECAAPRLLQYAFTNNMQPIGIGEFWYGAPLGGEVRVHGNFYEACVAKCHPILKFMLQGLEIEQEKPRPVIDSLEVLFEDEYLIAVNKPCGVLSVPGRTATQSVIDILKNQYPESEFYSVHRLDEDTSGVLLLAKSIEVQKQMQKLFAMGKVKKKYLAVLLRVPNALKGTIELPIRADYEHRPRQIVDFEHGKPAFTQYKVVRVNDDGTCVVEFYPHTGRTHQLRVHSAHPNGLASPIVGDRLYGSGNTGRMMLHAAAIEFSHPVKQSIVVIASDSLREL